MTDYARLIREDNPYQSLIQGDQAQALQGAMAGAAATQPDVEAKLRQLSKQVGVPLDSVRLDPPQAERQAAIGAIDYNRMVRENPITAGFLTEQAAVARDDVGTLTRIERAFSAFGQGIQKGSLQEELGPLHYKAMTGEITPAEQARRKQLNDQMKALDALPEKGDSPLSWFLNVTGYTGRQMVTSVTQAAPGALAGATAGAAVGGLAAPVAPVTATGGAILGARAGYITMSTVYNYKTEAGFAFDEFEGLKTVDGKPMPRDVAQGAAAAVGLLNAGLETVGELALLKLVPGLDKLMAGGAKQAVKTLLQRPTFRAAIADAGKRWMKAASIEGLTEGLQEITVILGRELAQGVAPGQFPATPIGQDVERVLQATAEGAAGAAGVGAPATGVRAGMNIREVRIAQRNQDFMVALGESAQASKLRERLPEVFRDFVKKAREGGPVENVYIPADQFARYFQSQNVDPAAVAAEVGAANFGEAMAAGTDVVIPLENYAEKIAATQHHSGLLQDVKLHQGDLTMREAKAMEQRQQELQAELEAMIDAESGKVAAPVVEQIKQEAMGELVGRYERGTAEAYATTYAKAIASLAQRAGIDPMELHRQYGLRVVTPLPDILQQQPNIDTALDPLLDRLRAGDLPTEAQAFGPSLFEFIRDRGGLKPVGETKAMDENVDRRAFQRKITQPNGMSLDTAMEAAVEAGYFMQQGDEMLGETDLLDALAEDVAGNRVFSPQMRNEQAAALREQLTALAQFIEQLGGDVTNMDNVALKALIFKAAQTPAEDGQQFDQSATLRSGRETLKKYGLIPGEKYKTRQVAAALEARQRAKYGLIAADDRSPEALGKIAKWMAEEVMFEMQHPEKSGVGWYSEKFQRALDVFGDVYPELKTDQNARNLLTALIAITSDGQKVVPNFAQAIDVYGNFRESGKFTTDRGHIRQDSIVNNLAKIQELHDTLGPEGMRDYLMQEATVSELKRAAAERGIQFSTQYQANIKLPMAALVFGPKLGAFYANLMGAHGYLTMDRWWSRTFNRYRGTLLSAPTKDGLVRFRALLAADKGIDTAQMSEDELLSATIEYRESYEAKSFKNGTEIEKAANTIYKDAFEGLEDSPFNAKDRTFMLEAVQKARQSLKRRGADMSIADIQAVLWYYEKRLYGELGARQTADISYEEAARKVAATIADGSGDRSARLAALSDAEAVGQRDAETVAPGEEDFVEDGGDVTLYQSVDEYAGSHRPPKPGNGAPLNDLTVIYPDDIYSANAARFYGTGDAAMDRASMRMIQSYRNNPDAPVKIYRAVPAGVSDAQINSGDWVTINRQYAIMHGEGPLQGDYKIIEKMVTARELFTQGDFIHEWGYWADGKETFFQSGATETLADIQDQWDAAGIRNAMFEKGGVITLSQIVVPQGERGAGKGTAAMQALVEYADRTGQRIALSPSADFGGNKNRLMEFYKRFGFVENKGRNKDFRVSETMIREPQGGRMFQADDGDKRGFIQFGADRKFTIGLLEKADLSTFLHETGHFWLEVLGDLAERQDAAEQIKADYQTLLDWFGVKSRAEITVEHHEKFARANEAYLMEGKAPSAELRGIFQRFRAWLSLIYRSMKSLNVQLNDDVRGVLDRIYATDEEIEAAKRQLDAVPLFTTAAEAGMTEGEFAAYRKTVEAASEAAKEKLQGELMREYQRAREKWWKEQRASMRLDVEAEVDATPVYQAFAALVDGKLPDGMPIKLSKDDLVRRYGEEYLKRLPRGFQRIYTAEGGATLDVAAETLGFDSGQALVEALVNMRPRKDLIEAETDARMAREYGDMMLDGTIAEEAMQAIHNEERAKIIAAELRALRRQQSQVQPVLAALSREEQQARRTALDLPSVAVFRAAAAGRIGQMQAKDINPHQYLLAERRASRAAYEAAAKKDYVTAATEKQRELMNHYLYLEATKARQEIDKVYEYMGRFQKAVTREKLGKAGADYLDQIDAILERYEFKRVSLTALAKRKSLLDFVQEMESDGLLVNIPDALLDEVRRVNYREATVDELRAVRDTVKNIEHLATLKNKLLRKREAIEFAAVKAELIDSARDNFKPTGELGKPNRKGETVRDKGARLWKWFDAKHLKVEQLVEWLDGGKIDGPWARYLFDQAADAQTREYELHAMVTAKLQELAESMPKEWREGLADKTGVTLPGIDGPVTRYTLLSLALNTGNASNLQRMRDGYGWSDATIASALGQLTADDARFVQGVWDTVNSLWPEIVALEKRVTGVAPPKVEATPVTIGGVEVAGGYFPLVYDSRLSAVGEKQAEATESVGQFLANAYGRARTDRGYTKQRVETLKAPVLLDFEQVLTSHLTRVIKDVSHREAIYSLNKILKDGDIKATLIDTVGEEQYRELNKWVQVLVADRADTLHQATGAAKLIMQFRTNMAIVTMGWKISTMMAQFAGFGPSADLVKPRYLTQALVDFNRYGPWSSHRETLTNMVYEKSGEMKFRADTIERDVRDSLRRMQGDNSPLTAIRKTAFYLTAMADRQVTIPTWIGAYRQALAEGQTEESAVRAGDRAVRLSQGSGGSKDLAAVQRDNELMRLLTMYYSPFSVLYARLRDLGHTTRRVEDMPRAVARVLALVILPAVLGDLLAAKGPGDDEDKVWWAIRKALLYPIASIPVVRDLSSYLEARLIAIAGNGEMKFAPSFTLSPVVGAMDKLARLTFMRIPEALQGQRPWDDVAWETLETSGYVLGLPTAQVRITGEYITDVLTNQAHPETPQQALHDLLFRREQPR